MRNRNVLNHISAYLDFIPRDGPLCLNGLSEPKIEPKPTIISKQRGVELIVRHHLGLLISNDVKLNLKRSSGVTAKS